MGDLAVGGDKLRSWGTITHSTYIMLLFKDHLLETEFFFFNLPLRKQESKLEKLALNEHSDLQNSLLFTDIRNTSPKDVTVSQGHLSESSSELPDHSADAPSIWRRL